MSTTDGARPMISSLGRIYPQATEWAYLLLRVTAGLMLIPHVWPKLMAGPAAVAANVMVRRGVEPALAAAYVAIIVEVAGAILITLGLFTRAMALLLVIEFLVIVKVHFVGGGWGVSKGGAEFAFLWLIVYVFILARGGGRYSVDAKMGREL
jgi:putative oxidoreductase